MAKMPLGSGSTQPISHHLMSVNDSYDLLFHF